MKKRVYLHIGLHKTGSTTIQIALARQLAQLRAHSYDLPTIREGYPYHHTLVEPWVRLNERYCTGLDAEASWSSLLESFDRSGCQAAIISSEEFSNVAIDDEQVAWFAEQLADHEVRIILYLRRQDSFLESAYKEVKKHWRWQNFEQYWSDAVEGTLRLDFPALVALWGRHFGTEHIRLFDYHRVAEEGKDLVASFLELCDLPSESLTLRGAGSANVSGSSLGVALKDYLELNELANIDQRIAPLLPIIEQHLTTHGMRASFISATLRRELIDRFIDRNRTLDMDMTAHLRGDDPLRPVCIDELLTVPALRKRVLRHLIEHVPPSLQSAA